jgi:hypothetical protein
MHPFTPAKHLHTQHLGLPGLGTIPPPFRPLPHTYTHSYPNTHPHTIPTIHSRRQKESKLTHPKQEGDPKPKSYAQSGATASTTDGASTGVGLYAIILIGGALAFGAYKYLQAQSEQQ